MKSKPLKESKDEESSEKADSHVQTKSKAEKEEEGNQEAQSEDDDDDDDEWTPEHASITEVENLVKSMPKEVPAPKKKEEIQKKAIAEKKEVKKIENK